MVPPLFDNICLTLVELEIKELYRDSYPKHIKKRKFYKMKGDYEKTRINMLHPELREKTLRESLLQSYKGIDGKLSPDSNLFEILKDYSKIIFEEVISDHFQ